MTTPELMIEARDLRRSFATKEAVAGISFTTRKGEIFGLLGPNGAGKTTTIHMLTGQIEPSGGSVDITKAGSGGEYDLERESAISCQRCLPIARKDDRIEQSTVIEQR